MGVVSSHGTHFEVQVSLGFYNNLTVANSRNLGKMHFWSQRFEVDVYLVLEVSKPAL